MFSYILLDANETKQLLYQGRSLPVLKSDDQHRCFINFHYFNAYDLVNMHKPKNLLYMIAHKGDLIARNIVGVLKIADYGDDSFNYTAVNFIDVHKDYKRQGIATNLVKALNYYLNSDDVLTGSRLSTEGKESQINRVFHRYITNCQYYDTSEEYYQQLMEMRKNV